MQTTSSFTSVWTRSRTNAFSWLRQAWQTNRPLTLVGLISVGALLFALAGILISPLQVLNEPAWLKPAKFAVSIALYSFTFIWLLSFVRNAPRMVSIISWITAAAFVIEIVIIFYQASRGVRSHFNLSTPVDGLLFGIMGGSIYLLWAASLVAAILLLRQRIADPVMGHALRLGLVLAVVGSGIGGLMTLPTPEQSAAIAAGDAPPTTVGAHSVGVADGGEGLPIVGWSTEGGDLRIPHFIGLHAMQIVPLVGVLLASRRGRGSRRSTGEQVGLVWLAGLSYLGLMALTLWQALRGQPLLAPDGWTMAAAVALAGASAAALIIILSGRSPLRNR